MKEEIKKTFAPGSEWVYYKLYCGINTADSIITNVLIPLTSKLIEDGVIDKWFFIRYQDPEYHLRVRFHVKSLDTIGSLIQQVYEVFESHIENNLIWNLQIATYNRELERYGENTMKKLESYFHYDSELVAKIIQESQDEESRFYNVFIYIDNIIDSFLLTPESKLSFLNNLQLSFKKEFKINAAGKKQLSKKYRSFKTKIVESDSLINNVSLELISSIVVKIRNFDGKNKLKVSLENLLGSIIHMTANRCFQSRQRLYEMVLYDFLYQKSKSDYYLKKR